MPVSNTSSGSLRHVGEGALDDSDSEDGGSAHSSEDGSNGAGAATEKEKEKETSVARDKSRSRSSSSNVVSPTTLTFSRVFSAGAAPSPSPLSRVAGPGTWTDSDEPSDERLERDDGEADEDEDSDSPSPASTDTDSDDSPRDASAVRLVSAERERVASGASASVVRSKSRSQTRSRKNSVTLRPKNKRSATLAVTVPRNDPKSLAKQGSMNSMRTVTAEETSLQQPEHAHDGLEAVIMGRKESDHRRVIEGGAIGRDGSPLSIKRGVSVGGPQAAAGSLFASTSLRGEKEERSEEENGVQGQRFKAEIEKQHETMKGWGWNALKAALEAHAEEGDVQICAMMALVAGEELQVKPSRLVRFVDSYIGESSSFFSIRDRTYYGIDRLTRFKLYTAAAYLRKHAPAEDARAATNVSSRSE